MASSPTDYRSQIYVYPVEGRCAKLKTAFWNTPGKLWELLKAAPEPLGLGRQRKEPIRITRGILNGLN